MGKKFALVTRHYNRSGYTALRTLIEAGLPPSAIIVSDKTNTLSHLWKSCFVKLIQKVKCVYYRCDDLRFLDSEELLAKKHRIPVIRVDSLKKEKNEAIIKRLDLDLLVVAGGWHEKISPKIFNASREGTVNLHPSLLPNFKGTSITRWQIYEGIQTAGVTVHQMDDEFDSGKIVAQSTVPIPENSPPQTLFQILSLLGSSLLLQVLLESPVKTIYGSSEALTVDKRYNKYYRKWQWTGDALAVNTKNPLRDIHNHIIAATQESYEYPGPKIRLDGSVFIIRKSALAPRRYSEEEIGHANYKAEVRDTVLRWERHGEGTALLIKQIQPCYPRHYLRRAHSPSKWFAEGSTVDISEVFE
ncbi:MULTISPECIES: formyltransferase family protein [unclassified Halorhodospira]|uniref:formyltransferase family protein n=1 Tax=unclassified Halorhodospira TaxID=2626748 RepID=UPI001EE87727|nr:MULTISPECIES: formyltransferase family protein [unclassified Halorhodospira]MCG5541986.1 hypothetical protein [Halorhodospira sp. M39old]MCG5547049.1 hypothetical protein [Halorhodospira sp. M38]